MGFACVDAEDDTWGADVTLSSCVVDLTPAHCSFGICRAVIHFSPVTDFVLDGNRKTNISVKPIVTDNYLWNRYTPEPTQVKYKCMNNYLDFCDNDMSCNI